MTANSESIEEIRNLLSAFNSGYSRRDLASLDDFMNHFSQYENLEFIATGGASPGRGTWRVGKEAVRDLVRSDWEYWGLIHVDEEKARINVLNDVAWLSTSATVTTDDETEEFLGDKEEITGAVQTMSATDGGRVKPLRMTAILVKEEGQWRFAHIHLSFSIRSLPK